MVKYSTAHKMRTVIGYKILRRNSVCLSEWEIVRVSFNSMGYQQYDENQQQNEAGKIVRGNNAFLNDGNNVE